MGFNIKEKSKSIGDDKGTEAWRITPARTPDIPPEASSSSFFRKAVAFTPIAVGTGVAFSRMRGNTSITGNILGRVQAAAKEATAPSLIQEMSSAFWPEWTAQQLRMQKDQLLALQQTAARLGTTAQGIIKSQFIAASRIGDPRAGLLQQKVQAATNPLDIILEEMQQHLNVDRPLPHGLAKTVRGFKRRLEGFASHIEAGGSLDVFQKRTIAAPSGRNVPIPASWLPQISALEETLKGAEPTATLFRRKGAVGGYYRLQFSGGILQQRGLGRLTLDIERNLTTKEAIRLGLPEHLAGSIVATGMSQQTIGVAGQFAEITGQRVTSTLKYPQFVLNQAKTRLMQLLYSEQSITKAQLRHSMSEFREEMLGYRQVFPGYLAEENRALRLQMEIAAAERHIFGEGFMRAGTPDEMQELIRTGSFFPVGTPKRTVGDVLRNRPPKLTTLDPATLHVGGEFFPGARKPFQFAKGISPSAGAIEWMAQSKLHEDTSYLITEKVRETVGPYGSPRFRRAYLASQYTNVLEQLGAGEGEEIISSRLLPALETTKYHAVELEAESINASLLAQGAEGTEEAGVGRYIFKNPLVIGEPNLGLKEGQIAGIVASGANQGRDFELTKGMRILGWQEIAKSEIGEGKWKSTVRLEVAEDIATEMSSKGYQQRASRIIRDQRAIELGLGAIGAKVQSAFGPVLGVSAMDELRKNRSSHNMQMFSQLVEATRELMQQGKLKREQARSEAISQGMNPAEWNRRFLQGGQKDLGPIRSDISALAQRILRDPSKWNENLLRGLKASAGPENTLTTRNTMEGLSDIYIQKLWKTARKLHLSPEAIGGIFGAVPEIWKLDTQDPETLRQSLIGLGLKGVTSRQASEINKRIAYGIGMSYPGGEQALMGAGSMGRLEARAFELMGGEHFGPLGKTFQAEFAERVLRTRPELLKEQQLMVGAFSEFTGQKHGVDFGGLPTYKLSELSDDARRASSESFVGKTGGIIDLEGVGGLKKLVIPRSDDLSLLSASGDITEDVFESPLMRQYGTFLQDAAAYQAGDIGKGSFEVSEQAMREALWKGYTGTIVGKNKGILASDLPGSRFLKIRSPLPEMKLPQGVSGVGRRVAEEMFDEMEALYPGEMQDLRKEFFEERKPIPAFTFRHPAVHLYSGQPAMMQLVTGRGTNEKVIFMAEARQLATEVASGATLGKIDLGPLRGAWADKDGDNAILSMLRGSTSQKVRQQLGPEFLQQYEEINIRNQILENIVKGGKGFALGELEGRGEEAFKRLKISEDIAGMIKLGTPTQYVGRMSTALSQARRAVEFSNLTGQEKIGLESMFALQEQLPISGKHLSSKEVLSGYLDQSFKAVSGAVSKGLRPGQAKEGAAQLIEAFRSMYSGNPVAERLFAGENIKIRLGEETTERVVKGMPLKQFISSLGSAFEQYSAVGIDGLSEATKQRLYRGQITPTREQAGAALGARPWLLGQFKQAFRQEGKMAEVSRVAQAALNEATVLGKKVAGIASKPLAWGFGASIALATLLSKPVSNLEEGASQPPPNALLARRTGTQVSPEDLGAAGQIMGNPSTPNYPGPGNARISPPGKYPSRVRAYGQSPGGIDHGALGDRINQVLAGKGYMRIQIADKRTSLNEQKISEMLGN